MKYLLLILLTGCIPVKQGSLTVTEVIQLCDGEVKSFSKLTQKVECKNVRKIEEN